MSIEKLESLKNIQGQKSTNTYREPDIVPQIIVPAQRKTHRGESCSRQLLAHHKPSKSSCLLGLMSIRLNKHQLWRIPILHHTAFQNLEFYLTVFLNNPHMTWCKEALINIHLQNWIGRKDGTEGGKERKDSMGSHFDWTSLKTPISPPGAQKDPQ